MNGHEWLQRKEKEDEEKTVSRTFYAAAVEGEEEETEVIVLANYVVQCLRSNLPRRSLFHSLVFSYLHLPILQRLLSKSGKVCGLATLCSYGHCMILKYSIEDISYPHILLELWNFYCGFFCCCSCISWDKVHSLWHSKLYIAYFASIPISTPYYSIKRVFIVILLLLWNFSRKGWLILWLVALCAGRVTETEICGNKRILGPRPQSDSFMGSGRGGGWATLSTWATLLLGKG